MYIRSTTLVSLAAALVGVQHSIAFAMPDEDMRAGVPQRLDPDCPNSNGKIMCASNTSLLICDHEQWRFLSNCPEGTMCQNNQCINEADFTPVAPANPPSRPPSVPTSTTSTTSTTTTSSTSTKPSSQSSQSSHSTQSSTEKSVSISSSPSGSSHSSSIPNIVEVTKLPISVSGSSKPSNIPNISEVDRLPGDSSSSSAAGQLSWRHINMAIPVVSAVVVPYIFMLLF
ncbi:hypothetical protein H4S07_000021 [Coemansia furcata]|uniref:Uncharacterized protein n=1 Tax=Coemansia furcata TaxID=417177 RepID=A0ACC1LSC0_9FUNG|nr:hypothetical protein H4S07_000021 [Coemansia furcata]